MHPFRESERVATVPVGVFIQVSPQFTSVLHMTGNPEPIKYFSLVKTMIFREDMLITTLELIYLEQVMQGFSSNEHMFCGRLCHVKFLSDRRFQFGLIKTFFMSNYYLSSVFYFFFHTLKVLVF